MNTVAATPQDHDLAYAPGPATEPSSQACHSIRTGRASPPEPSAACALIQTDKIRHFPVLLSLSAPWDGLLAWVEGEAAPAGGRVGARGLAMLHRCDHPADVVRLSPLAHAAQAMAAYRVSRFRVGVPTPEP